MCVVVSVSSICRFLRWVRGAMGLAAIKVARKQEKEYGCGPHNHRRSMRVVLALGCKKKKFLEEVDEDRYL